MGSHNFTWAHPATEVYVTGTFDAWGKTEKLEKKGDIHEKVVTFDTLPTEKILYKFVADGTWSHDHTAKTETDHEGNVNNVLYPEDIKRADPMISSAAPGATTASLAGQQPLEKEVRGKDTSQTPGTFPGTPALTSSDEKKDGLAAAGLAAGLVGAGGAGALASKAGSKEPEQTFSVNPIPASSGVGNPISLAAGEKVPEPSTITSNTIASTVRDDPSLKSSAEDAGQTFGVAPLPATGGIGNPISLAPGEKVPDSSSYTASNINSHVKLDKDSYENSGSSVPVLPPKTGEIESDTAAGGALLGGLGPQTTNMIPESSMGMGADAPAPLEGQAISSVGANSTTNELAGQVPLEPRGVPVVVKESQKDAGVAPEASANPEAVQEKKDVESELKDKIGKPEDQTSGAIGGAFGGLGGGALAGGILAGAGATALGVAAAARQKAHETTGTDPVSLLPTSVQKTVDENTRPNGSATERAATADTVPAAVTESQKEAHAAPEASANAEAVHEKSDVEKELLNKVPESQATGDSAPGIVNSSTKSTGEPAPTAAADAVPVAVAESQKEAHAAPEASANAEAVHEKSDVEKELLNKVPESQATGDSAPGIVNSSTKSAGEPAPTAAADAVPVAVAESQKEAHAAPEASANAEAVHEKSDVEKELLNKVPESQATGDSAPAVASSGTMAPASGGAPGYDIQTGPDYVEGGVASGVTGASATRTAGVSEPIATSTTSETGATTSNGAPQLADPTEGVAALSMNDKSKDIDAPASSQAEVSKPTVLAADPSKPMDSRDVSPMSKPKAASSEQAAPVVTTGVSSGTAPATSEASKPVGTPRTSAGPSTPAKRNSMIDRFERFKGGKEGTPDSSKTDGSSTKKKGRLSRFFDKLKN
ncbi:carbohydrate-binding module family 48 protein [Sphaerulina musiva SO2202]|uniref:Carbohydrate-binding module family 48 protein n=1 Tax=Sphaerulina musiva (strain SO2202) TaxID=692275 RepID=M3C1F9_SPHMS|nr:carbohydrate-binding module family 48 protein [Sphaerulina musiva SO2202]EMF14141.1 carbohydrate-binding module family 48 protein [Sphaerulina musiva SO2202]